MYKSLEALRIISAMMVVSAHFKPTTIPFFSWFFGGRIFLGSIGVDVFFIISGIVMGLTFDKRTGALNFRSRTNSFLLARVRKVFPLYVTATLLAVTIAPLFGRPFPNFDRFFFDLLLVPHMTGDYYIDPIIGAGWTLRYEIFFYLIVFISLALNNKYLTTILMLGIAFGLPIDFGYYSSPILLEFIFGYLISSQIYYISQKGSLKLRLVFLGVATIIFLLASTGKDFSPGGVDTNEIPRMLIYFGNYSGPRFLIWGIPAFILVLATVSLESYIPKKLSAMGRYTYSLYLMQYFCLPIEYKLLARGFSEIIALGITLAILVALTILGYVLIEKPFSSWGLRRVKK